MLSRSVIAKNLLPTTYRFCVNASSQINTFFSSSSLSKNDNPDNSVAGEDKSSDESPSYTIIRLERPIRITVGAEGLLGKKYKSKSPDAEEDKSAARDR